MSRLPSRALAILAVAALAQGCGSGTEVEDWPKPPSATPEANPQRNPDSGPHATQILGFSIFREAPDHILVDVEYFNSGRENVTLMVGGFAVGEPGSRIHTAYRPEMADTGHHKARIWIGIASDEPESFTTSHLRLNLYNSRTGNIASRELPYAKTWQRPEPEKKSE